MNLLAEHNLPFMAALVVMQLLALAQLAGALDFDSDGGFDADLDGDGHLGFVEGLLGAPLDRWLAAALTVVPALPMTGLVARPLAAILPRDETTAVSLDSLVGREAPTQDDWGTEPPLASHRMRCNVSPMRRWLVPILALVACASGAEAQAVPAPTLNDVQALVLEDKMMPAVALLEQVMAADPATIPTGAQYWSFSGDLATADELFVRQSNPPSGALPDLSQVRPEPAIEAILRAAEGRRIVIINEAHHAPRHRAFTHRLMLELREAGFTHLAAETFCSGSHCGALLTDGAPMGGAQTGFYTTEPVFGDLARQAGAAGYTLLGYEIRPDQFPPAGTPQEEYIAIREQAQAENLKALLDADPTMRVLVHVGFGHVNETERGMARHMFAGRLKEMTGEDPLTIDQVEGTPQHGAYDSLVFQSFLAQFGPPEVPIIIANDPASPFGYYRVDLSVIHPAQQWVDGRADWLAMGGYRQPHRVALEPLGERSLVRAFVIAEPDGAIAMDQLLVGPDAEAVTLMLPAGDYRLVRQTEAGEDLLLGNVSVN